MAKGKVPTRDELLAFIKESATPVGKREIARAFGLRPGDRILTWSPSSPGLPAAYIGAKPQRIYDLRSSGALKRHGHGRRALISRDELDDFITRDEGR